MEENFDEILYQINLFDCLKYILSVLIAINNKDEHAVSEFYDFISPQISPWYFDSVDYDMSSFDIPPDIAVINSFSKVILGKTWASMLLK